MTLRFQVSSSGPGSLQGEIFVPGDKSLTHRAVLFAAIAHGTTSVITRTLGRDNFATMRIMSQLGVEISGELHGSAITMAEEEGLSCFQEADVDECHIRITGQGFAGLRAPTADLNCGNSGTTARLLCGLLAGRPFRSRLMGDSSLSRRPFRRVTEPLALMGAKFSDEKLPLEVEGSALHGIDYVSPRASAQVKSAVILAGLQAEGRTSVCEPVCSRDHTERMLKAMGCELEERKLPDGRWEVVLPKGNQSSNLRGSEFHIPGDFSAAAFFLVAASICPGSSVCLRNVGVNPTRIGLANLLHRMGAELSFTNLRTVVGEEIADIEVRSAHLRAIEVNAEDVVLAIDEIPILAVAAAFASGKTVIRGAEELRVKESDRLAMIAAVLSEFGVEVEELPDGLVVTGNPKFVNSQIGAPASTLDWRRSGDHRISMCAAVLQYALQGGFELADVAAVETSFPNFFLCFQQLTEHLR